MIRNVIFDLGRVLLHWEPEQALAKSGYSETERKAAAEYMYGHPDWLRFDRGEIRGREAARVFGELSGLAPQRVHEMLVALGESLSPIPLGMGLFDWVRAQGYPVFCLSNMPPDVYDRLLVRFDWFEHFAGVVVSGRVNRVKPEPEIFEHALRDFQVVAEETLFIDDLAPNVAAAREAGLQAVQFQATEACVNEVKALLGGG